MAPPVYRDQREARAFMCHVWLSVSCVILSAVFFGMSTINKVFIFVGIFTMVLSLLVFSLYFICRRGRSKDDGCFQGRPQGQCCFYCCDSCIRTIFCLGPRMAQPRSPTSRMAFQNALTQREIAAARSSGYDNFAMAMPTSATPHIPPSYSLSDRRAELRSLETEIHELLLDCSGLEEQPNGERDATARERSLRRSDRERVNIHDSLSTEYGLLSSWIEGNRDIPNADIERMRSGLQHLRRRLCVLESGVTTRPMSNPGSALHLQAQPTLRSIVGVASLTAPLPPIVHNPGAQPTLRSIVGVASLTAPLPPIVHNPGPSMDVRQGTDLPPPYREYDAPQAARLQAGQFELIGRPDSDHFRLPYYLVPPTVAPPVDESGAPPTYEEASSSQV